MATAMKRHRSRRRVAALTFLSNISLDGTYRDTKLALLNRNGSFAKFKRGAIGGSESSSDEKENVNNYTLPCADANTSSAELCLRETIHQILPKCEDTVSTGIIERERKAPISEFKRSYSTYLEPGVWDYNRSSTSLDRGSRKKLVSQPTLHSGSSTESLGGRCRKTSSSISDSSANSSNRELRFVKVSKESHIKDERVVLLSSKKVPSYIFTTVPHHRKSNHQSNFSPSIQRMLRTEAKSDTIRRRHASSGNRPLSTISDGPDGMFDLLSLVRSEDGQDVSYSQLLVPSRSFFQRRFLSQEAEVNPEKSLMHIQLARCFSYDAATTQRSSGSPPPNSLEERAFEYDDISSLIGLNAMQYSHFHYTPDLLDDPEFFAGKHRTIMNFPSYLTSVIDYVRPSDLKKELNDKFRTKFPHIQLTLSKLRSLKREMRKIAKQECNIDLLTVAQAYVYFEKLILKNLVNKQNRKLCAGACLMLSAKLNDVKGAELKQLIEKIESTFRLNRKELLASEFAVLVALEFSLHLPTWEIFPLYQRVLYDS